MAKIEIESSIASSGISKSLDVIIESVASLYLCHPNNYFISYERIEQKTVRAASMLSVLVGKSLFIIAVGGGFHMEAFHGPQSQKNIISEGLLKRGINIMFTMDYPATDAITCLISLFKRY